MTDRTDLEIFETWSSGRHSVPVSARDFAVLMHRYREADARVEAASRDEHSTMEDIEALQAEEQLACDRLETRIADGEPEDEETLRVMLARSLRESHGLADLLRKVSDHKREYSVVLTHLDDADNWSARPYRDRFSA